ncbi:MAG TPA: phosphatase PAP2 family protein [Candidatus Acidoferrales bacterium]|jgi:membrane-associated phospholipid phosphatase|nr:phosphatase PAP2 family protein [Candidatus Acidoferrales bacterium]
MCWLLLLFVFFFIQVTPVAAQGARIEQAGLDAGDSTSLKNAADISRGDTPAPQDGADADSTDSSANAKTCDLSAIKTCLTDLLGDQAGIWTSPARLRPHDALWLLPLAAATGISLNYDVPTLQQVSASPNRIRISNDLSNAGTYGAIGIAGASYVFGKVTHNETARETGVLSLETIADASVVTEVLKLATNRERPYTGTGQGRFWPNGTNSFTFNSSFPSEHSTVIWAFSHVVADETPGHWWLHLGLYAIATGVSVSRVTSRNHFPSDVVVGSAIGYLTGGYVYRRHSNSYDNTALRSAFIVSPIYDAPTRSYGIGVTVDPAALHSTSLKKMWSNSIFVSAH